VSCHRPQVGVPGRVLHKDSTATASEAHPSELTRAHRTKTAERSGAVSEIAAQVPDSVKANGTLTVAADATYAPNEFIGTEAQAEKCKPAGKPGMTVQVFNDQNAVNLALSSGRAQVAMADSPVAAYQVKQSNGTFKVSGSPYGTAPYGIAIPKNNGMADPTLAAVTQLMSDGTYTKILGKWGVQGGAISNPAINAGIS